MENIDSSKEDKNNTKIISEKEEEKIRKKFNKETRVLEWTKGVTYFIPYKIRSLKSSSLDELYEMFKADYLGLPIPERKHFLDKTK